eukprot:31176-Pelagococcus_subviridis.AAC.50
MLRGHEKKIAALEEEREEEIKQRENDAEKAVNEMTERVGSPNTDIHQIAGEVVDSSTLSNVDSYNSLIAKQAGDALKQEEEVLEQLQCQVCCNNDITHVLVACGHLYCERCLISLGNTKAARQSAEEKRACECFWVNGEHVSEDISEDISKWLETMFSCNN